MSLKVPWVAARGFFSWAVAVFSSTAKAQRTQRKEEVDAWAKTEEEETLLLLLLPLILLLLFFASFAPLR